MFFLTLHPFQFASTVREGHGPTTSVRCLLGSHFLTYELYKKIAFPNPVMLPGCVNPATTNSKIFMAKNISIAVPSFRRASSASNWLLWKIFFPVIKRAPLDYVFWPTTCSSHWCGKKKYICKSMVPAFKVLIMKSPSHTLIHTNHRISPRFILHTDPTNERQKHATLCCIQLIQIKCG